MSVTQLPSFCLHQAATLHEALEHLWTHREAAKVLSGGTDLLPRMRSGAVETQHLVSINHAPELARIESDGDALVIGATARVSDVAAHPLVAEHYPALAHACTVMATTQIRNMASVGGNIANGSPCADTSAPLLVYDASVELACREGKRSIELASFFLGPKQVDLRPAELLVAIRLPRPHSASRSHYIRMSARSKVDMAAVGTAGSTLLGADGRIQRARLALSAVAPTPIRCPEAEKMLVGAEPSADLIAKAANACVRASRPIDDIRASADYRRHLVGALVKRVLNQCLGGAQ